MISSQWQRLPHIEVLQASKGLGMRTGAAVVPGLFVRQPKACQNHLDCFFHELVQAHQKVAVTAVLV
jgi:hypothetical protein